MTAPCGVLHTSLINPCLNAHSLTGTMLRRLMQNFVDTDLTTAAGRALVEERYWSLRKQVPIVYLLGFVNLSGMELATSGKLSPGFNLPTFIAFCALIRIGQWFGGGKQLRLIRTMVRRMRQTVLVRGRRLPRRVRALPLPAPARRHLPAHGGHAVRRADRDRRRLWPDRLAGRGPDPAGPDHRPDFDRRGLCRAIRCSPGGVRPGRGRGADDAAAACAQPAFHRRDPTRVR